LVPDIERIIKTVGTEGNTWTSEGESNRKIEAIS
jgi:hypothetical protein